MKAFSKTIFIGKVMQSLQEVDSTNAYLRRLLDSGENVPDGSIVSAASQSAGRGQGNRQWLSEPGQNITMSILFRPAFLSPRHLFYFNKSVALSLCEFASDYTSGCRIKWPNDLYAERCKIGGVLIESLLAGDTVKYVITGIGININQEKFPPGLPNPASLRMLTKKTYDLQELAEGMSICIERNYLRLRASDFHTLDAAYHASLYGMGKEMQFLCKGKSVRGTIQNVDPEGRIRIQMAGAVKVFAAGEIAFAG